MASCFELTHEDGQARAGTWALPHGDVLTPAFMPVGTQGSVKTLAPWEVESLAPNIILANNYHLIVRPGTELIAHMGGLHKWTGWKGNILTDSGGFQVMSLASLRKITPDGVRFRSHLDGRAIELTPESVVEAQSNLGSDVMMVLDECTPYPASTLEAEKSMELSMKWAAQAWDYWKSHRDESPRQLLGIVQGGMYPDLRRRSGRILEDLEMDGYAIGGLSVGESKEQLREMCAISAEALPREKIRYLMGVGKPEDLVASVAMGVDVFDCVLPTRNARNGGFFLVNSPRHASIKNARFRSLEEPLDSACGCRACAEFSASYVHHLFKAGEILAFRLLTEHNLWVLHSLMTEVRQAIKEQRFEAFAEAFWREGDVERTSTEIPLTRGEM